MKNKSESEGQQEWGNVSKELGHHDIIIEQSESELSQKLRQSALGVKTGGAVFCPTQSLFQIEPDFQAKLPWKKARSEEPCLDWGVKRETDVCIS